MAALHDMCAEMAAMARELAELRRYDARILLSCPRCHGERSLRMVTDNAGRVGMSCIAHHCNAHSPRRYSLMDAVQAWHEEDGE